MHAFEIAELVAANQSHEHVYAEFLRAGTLSLGLAIWPAGSVDTQEPHTEDEVYYVVSGRARITVDGEEQPVGAGSIVFVAIGADHRFHDIEEDLVVLVFWAPPRHSRRVSSSP